MNESFAGKADDVTESIAPGLDQVIEAAREDVLDRILLGSAVVVGVGAIFHLLGVDSPGLLIYGFVFSRRAIFQAPVPEKRQSSKATGYKRTT